MKSYILFHVGTSKYALELDRIERIMMIPKFELATNKDKIVDGIFDYEKAIIPILCFRTMVSQNSYIEDLQHLFKDLKQQHIDWVEALKKTVMEDVVFQKATDPNGCNLGKWLNAFRSYDDEVIKALKDLNIYHKQLHNSAIDIIELKKIDNEKAKDYYENRVLSIYEKTIFYLETLASLVDKVANDSQKLLILSCNEKKFSLKVDEVDNIIHVDDSMIKRQASVKRVGKYVDIGAIIEYDDLLNSVIDDLKVENIV